MLSNYFKTAFRSLWRNRQFSIINIVGLTLGMVVFLFIMQYVAFEWSANRFNKDYNELYRVNVQYKEGNSDYNLPPGFAPIIKQKFPVIDGYVRVADNIASGVITYTTDNAVEKKVVRADNMKYADTNFLSLFSFPVVAGAKVLPGPQTAAISEAMSIKLYGSADAIDKTVTVSNQFGNTLYTVKSVYRLPKTSDIKADVLLSLQTLESAASRNGNDWADPAGTGSGYTSIYLKLRKDVRSEALASDITQFVRSINPGSKTDVIYLQPFKELHLAPSFEYAFQTYGNLLLVVVFAIVAILILGIAWLNYINLSTAQALNRAKEVGVRKVLGASRIQLMLQHLTETLLLTVASALVALFAVHLLQSFYNNFAGRDLSLAVLNTGWFWLAGACMIIAGSALSGSYVAFVITSFRPSDAIRSKGNISIRGLSVRKALVIFQFATSLVFIIATAVLYRQLQFMNNERLGMNLNQLVVIQGPTITTDAQAAKNAAFKNSLAQLPFVKKYTASNNVPGIGYNFFANGIGRLSAAENDMRKSYGMFICDERFFDTYDIRFAQGAGFTKADAEASWNNVKKVIINEKGAQQLGFDLRQSIIGQKLSWGVPYEIVGVVKDYHHLSLREPIQPTVYLASPSYSFFTVQTDIRNMQSKIAVIRNLYNQSFAGNPFEYFFADERYDQQYQAEQQLGKVFIAAAFVAILIACLGLYGLAAFAARRRVKEVGIRKVLGASVVSITALLSKDFLKLVIIALLIASPVAWWVMNRWLQNFAYRTNISIWIFLLSGAVGIAIALITVSFQAIKAARVNPVANLRSE